MPFGLRPVRRRKTSFGDTKMSWSSEIVTLIKTHPSAIFGIFGTVVGYVVNFVLDRWKQSGKITFTPLEMYTNIRPVGRPDPEPKVPLRVPGVHFQFHFRVLNTYPIPKSVSTHDVKVFPCRRRWWKRVSPLATEVANVQLGNDYNDQKPNTDLQCDAHSFTRLWVSGTVVPKGTDGEKIRSEMGKCGILRLRFLISPKKITTIWHSLDSSIQEGVKARDMHPPLPWRG
jgi:hypothetical protein